MGVPSQTHRRGRRENCSRIQQGIKLPVPNAGPNSGPNSNRPRPKRIRKKPTAEQKEQKAATDAARRKRFKENGIPIRSRQTIKKALETRRATRQRKKDLAGGSQGAGAASSPASQPESNQRELRTPSPAPHPNARPASPRPPPPPADARPARPQSPRHGQSDDFDLEELLHPTLWKGSVSPGKL